MFFNPSDEILGTFGVRGSVDVPLISPSARHESFIATLSGITNALDCQAMEFYLLDESTTNLECQTSYSTEEDSIQIAKRGDVRQLAGSIGDLEALCGSAVVLEEPSLMPYWHVPQECGAAVCVPVATLQTILGTLWIYSETARDFSDPEVKQLEIAAERLASSL